MANTKEVAIVVRVKDQFTQALNRAGTSVQQFATQAQGAAAKAKAAFGGIGKTLGENKLAFAAMGAAVLGVAKQLADMFMASVNAADGMEELAQKLGISTEELSALQYSAKLNGMEIEALSAGMKIFSRNMADASNGTGSSVQAFKALGVEVKNVDGTLKSQNQLMGEIADKFAETADGAGKTAIAMDIFGRSGADMIPMLNGGSAALKEQADEAARLGIILDASGAKKAAAFADAMDNLKASASGAMMGIVTSLAPALQTAFDDITGSIAEATNSGAFENWAAAFGRVVKFVIGGVRIIWNWFQIAGNNIGIVLGAMGASVVNVFETIINAAMAVGKAIKGVFTLNFDEVKAGFADFGTAVKGGFKQQAAVAGVAIDEIAESYSTNFADMGNAADLMFSSNESTQQAMTATTKTESKKRLDYQVIDEAAAAKAAKEAADARQKLLEEAAKKAEESRKQVVEAQKMLSDAKLAGIQQDLAAEGIGFEQQRALTAANFEQQRQAMQQEQAAKLIELQGNEEAIFLVKQSYALKEEQLKKEGLRADEAISKARTDLAISETKNALGNLARATEGSKKFFAMNKAFSMANAAVSGTESAVNSYAAGSKIGGPILGAVFAAASVAATGKMISDIASQKFAKGGFPRGRNALATLNDSPNGGQEAVLNAGAVRNLGFSQINALNAGRGLQGGGQRINISLGGVVVNGGDPAQVQSAIESGIDRAAQRLQRQLRYIRENNVPEAVFA